MAWADIIRARPAIPAALGAELEPYPYLSGFGLVHRITRLTACLPSQVSALGFRNRNVADVLLATQRASKPQATLLRVLGLQASHLARYWAPETWCPLQVQDLFRRQPRPLRQCPDCARHGYHCTLFQLPSITHCPWHGTLLKERCMQCGKLLHSRFDETGVLGRCACGHDGFDPVEASVHMWTFPGADAEAWIEDYLAWAARRRYSRWFCAPTANSNWDSGFAVLAAPPPSLQRRREADTGMMQVFCGAGADPPPRQFWGWSCWGGERPLTLAPLPQIMYPRLCHITQQVVSQLPENSKTPFDLIDANKRSASSSLRERLLLRPDCFISPRGTGEAATWLNLSIVDAGTAAFCGQLLDQVVHCLGDESGFQDRSLQAERSHALDQIQGRRHLSLALESLLTRAYRKGLEAVLRAKLGQPDILPVSRAAPVLELAGRPGRIRSVRLWWASDVPVGAGSVRPDADPSDTTPISIREPPNELCRQSATA